MTEIPQQQLPEDALRRLRETEIPGGRRLFTSDLTVNEFLLVEEAGFTPLGLVMGSSIYQIGLQTRRWSQSTELDKLTQAMYTARELAMTRMEEEADVLGADGIVGVRLDVNYYEWGKSTAEFIAVGTAVKARTGRRGVTPRESPSRRTCPARTSGRSCTPATHRSDWYSVRASTTWPIGHCSAPWAPPVGPPSCPISRRPCTTRGERAMTRMEEEASRLQAAGIVGVQLIEKSHMWGSHTIEFLAIGTGVRSLGDDHVVPPPVPVITMDH